MNNYRIVITHKPGPCPKLPDVATGDVQYNQEDLWECPTHLVFWRDCSIKIARMRIDLLKDVVDITTIRLKTGYGDIKDLWERDNAGKWSKQQ